MKKILLGLFLLSNLCYGWEYAKTFRYDLDANAQMIAQPEMQNMFPYLIISQVGDGFSSVNLSGNYTLGSVFDVKVYVDGKK